MCRLEIRESFNDAEVLEVTSLLDAAESVPGHPSVERRRWQVMVAAGAGAIGILCRAGEHRRLVAYAQVTRMDMGPSRHERAWALDLVVDPTQAHETAAIGVEALGAGVDLVGRLGGGRIHWWVGSPTDAHDAIARTIGMAPTRDLCQLRRPLPLDDSLTREPLTLRAFRPGSDEDAWLAVNNRAFHWHPEQGGWNRAILAERERESWFDPEGFLLHERQGRLAGFCWTKIHRDHEPALGEIFVIGVDPDFQGIGLGRSLVIAGLDRLADRGLDTGMLWVEGSNEPAQRLYRSLGFTLHHLDRTYTGEVPPKSTSEPRDSKSLDPDC